MARVLRIIPPHFSDWHFSWSLEMGGGKGSPGFCGCWWGTDFSVMPLPAPARGSCLPRRLRRAFCCGSARPALPGAKEKHMFGATLPAQQCQKQKPGCYKPCPKICLFHTSINFEEREERSRRGVFALVFLMKYNRAGNASFVFNLTSPACVWPDNKITRTCDERVFLDAMAADRGLVPPALHVKWSALPPDNAALVRNSCLGETARCCLTVACMLHRYVGYYLAGNESTRWDWMFLAGKWSLLLCIKTSCGSVAAWWNANIERNVAPLPPWIIYFVVYSGFIWNNFLIKPQRM